MQKYDTNSPISAWHHLIGNFDEKKLRSILHPDCCFYSPVIFTPQKGRKLTSAYLQAAFKMFSDAESFQYVKEIQDKNEAVLEFNSVVDGIVIDGIDMITWNEEGLITEFKVMIRPLKAIEKIREKMLEHLESLSTLDKLKMKAGKLMGRA